MLTRSGWMVALGAVVALAAGRLLAVVELYVFGTAGILLDLVAISWARRPSPTLQIDRVLVPTHVVVDGLARVDLTITNRGDRSSPAITMEDPVEGTVGARLAAGPLRSGAVHVAGYRLPTTRRGPLRVGPLVAHLTDPFGLARRAVSGAEAVTVTVLPALDPVSASPAGSGMHEPLGGASRRAVATAGVEDLVTLRPYNLGDDLRRVHWPSSAHADELLVRRDEERWQGHLTVVLDTRTGVLDPSEFERAVSAAAGLVHASSESADRLRLATTSGLDTGMVDARRSRNALMEHLAMVTQTEGGRPDEIGPAVPTTDGRRAGVVLLLTGPTDRASAEALRAGGFTDVTVVRFDDAVADTVRASPADVTIGASRLLADLEGRAGSAHPDARPERQPS